MTDKEDRDDNIPDEILSKINAAGLINLTINNLKTDFFNHFRAVKYISANNDLDCIWTILGGEVNIPPDIKKKYEEIEKELCNSGILQDGVNARGFALPSKEFLIKSAKQRSILLKKATFYTYVQNKQGKGTAYERGESDYMDE